MNKKLRHRKNAVAVAALVICATTLVGCVAPNSSTRNSAFTPRVYAGIGALASEVEPDTDAVQGTSVDESISGGASLTLGYDVNSRFSIEGYVADLGEATLDPAGSISYQVAAVSGLVYALNDTRNRSRRTGFSVYGKLGLGTLSNEAEVVDFNRVNDVHLLAGLGLEYGLDNGLGVRAEIVAHETDAKFAQLGLVYRFGEPSRRSAVSAVPATTDAESKQESPAAEATDTDSATDATVAAVPNRVEAVATNTDEDGDGVLAAADQCPETQSGVPVDAEGCAVFGGVIEGITFEVDSDTFTSSAVDALDGVARTLLEYPEIRVTIEAHTDNVGSAAANLQLSKRRALAVARYLVDQGISGARLKPQAFGESQPRTSNLTSQGRASNRRVEFSIQN